MLSKLGVPMAQSSLSQGTWSAGISDEITCTMSANGEQDLRMARVQRASTAVIRAPRPRKRAAGTDLQTQSSRNYQTRIRNHVPLHNNTRPYASRSSIRSNLLAPTASSLRVLLRELHLLGRISPWASVVVLASSLHDHNRLHHSSGSDRT